MKKFISAVLIGFCSFMIANFTCFAGTWKQTVDGCWWYLTRRDQNAAINIKRESLRQLKSETFAA